MCPDITSCDLSYDYSITCLFIVQKKRKKKKKNGKGNEICEEDEESLERDKSSIKEGIGRNKVVSR